MLVPRLAHVASSGWWRGDGGSMWRHPSTNHNSPHGRVVPQVVTPELSFWFWLKYLLCFSGKPPPNKYHTSNEDKLRREDQGGVQRFVGHWSWSHSHNCTNVALALEQHIFRFYFESKQLWLVKFWSLGLGLGLGLGSLGCVLLLLQIVCIY